ncbi:MAG: gliding motility-associated C-terminal domain-containing protein, partial [Flavobacterium sp.]
TNNFNGLSNDCSAAVTVVFTATDACGNFATTSATFSVQDTTAPVAPTAPVAFNGTCASDVPANITLTATDNCAGTITVTGVDTTVPGACPNSFVTTRTWTFTDACNNSSSVSQTITINDTVAPVAPAAPAAVTVACASEVPVTISLTATDNCGEQITAEGVDAITAGSCPNSYVITRTWTFADACGNTSSASQTINVNDNIAPVIAELPAPSTVSCPAIPEFAQATATDNCNGAVTLAFEDATTNGACTGSYAITRTWTATDACGNSSTASQTINVEDTTAPVIAALPAASTIDCPALPIFATATATDECGSAFTLTFEDATTNGACAGSYSITRTWTATDACGNASTATQTINVQDITPPAIATAAQNITVECDGNGSQGAIAQWLSDHAGAVAVDACSDVVWTNNFNALSNDCSAAVTVIFTATDACGNASNTSATFTVQDTTAPVAPEAPAAANVTCAGEVPANITLTANDNCSGTITAEGVDAITPGACANSYTIVRTWTFTDACNNASSVSQTINVNDTVAPVAPEAPAALTVACAGDVPVAGTLSATDNCGDVIVATAVDAIAAGSCPNSYVITRTWSFADACGNTSSTAQTITVNDTIAPVIAELPAPSTVSCPALPEFAQASATDNCEGLVTLTFEDATTNGACAGSYSVTRTWTATDACGNSSTASQTINVEDTTAPVIAGLPEASTINCPAAPEFATATAIDACGSDVTLTFADATTQGQCAGSYTIVRTWTATDACGNASTATQTINVQDVTAPEITTAASNITVECDGNGSQGAIAQWLENHGGAVATDACSNVTWTNNFNSLGNDCSAAVTVIFTATDACGNASNTSATFSVQDTTAPVAPQAPADVTAACSGEVPANITLTASDNCSGTITAEGVDAVTPGACANSYTIVRTWTFTDACNNSSSVSQTINVNDTVAPVAPEAPATITVACADEVPAMISLTATDNCAGDITVAGVDTTVAGNCPNSFVVTRTWTFTDACNNTSSVSQTINVIDTVAPVAPAAPADVTIACATDVPAMISLTATDNCNDQITAEGTDVTVPGNCPNSFTIVRTWTFTDACNNTSSVSQNIIVNDTVAPIAPAAPADITLVCTGEVPPMVSLTALDNCGKETITVQGVDTTVAGNCPNTFVTTRTWTFVDACGNQSSVSQTITVSDTVAPEVPANVPANVTVACAGDVPVASSLTANDNCGQQITADAVDTIAAGTCANSYVITRTWTFTDACGNSSTATQTISVNDNVAPTFNESAPADLTVSCDAIPPAATLTATDNCVGAATVTMAESTLPGTCPNSYTLVRTWSAADACGNIATATQSITVSDITPPTFDQPIPVKLSVSCDAVPTVPVITATDNCGTAAVTFVETRTDGACVGNYTLTRTWTATDLCGNQTTGSQAISVSDVTPPTVNETFDAVVNVNCDAIPTAPALTFSDNCSGVGQVAFNENITNQQPGSYTIVRDWTVADACGNQTVVTQTINVTIANSSTDISATACNEEDLPIDLNTLLPAGTPAGGTWVDVNNSGTLNGSTWNAFGIPTANYTLQYNVTDSACPRTVNINFSIECEVAGCGNIVIHNAFSPNGDGLNEFFSIEHLEEFECYPTNKVEIYNRWGVLIYETRQYDNALNSFKGTSEGRATVAKSSELPTGTYFYILEYTTAEGKTVKKDGYLYLSR